MISSVVVEWWVDGWMSGGRDLVMVLDLLLIYCMPLGRSIVFLGLSFPICTKLGEMTPGIYVCVYRHFWFQRTQQHVRLWRVLGRKVDDCPPWGLRSAAPGFMVINSKSSGLVNFPVPETRQEGWRPGCFLVIRHCIHYNTIFSWGVGGWVWTLQVTFSDMGVEGASGPFSLFLCWSCQLTPIPRVACFWKRMLSSMSTSLGISISPFPARDVYYYALPLWTTMDAMLTDGAMLHMILVLNGVSTKNKT